MPRYLSATAMGVVLVAFAAVAAVAAPKPVAAPPLAQSSVDNFRLVDETGRAHELYRLKDAAAVVIVMNGGDLKKSAAEIEKARIAYAAQGVEFFLLDSNSGSNRDAVAKAVAAMGICMPVLMDEQQLVGEQIGAAKTSEVFVINPKDWKVVYRGAFADGKKAYMANALDALIAGKPIEVSQTAVKGSTIKIPASSPAAKAEFAKISYSQTIAPILESKCVACHQQGGIAPFAMSSYEMVKGYAPMIRESVRTDRMPPWDPDPHIGKFKDDKSLSPEQIKTLVHWIEAGAPRGDGPDPLAATKHVAEEWPLGKPDLVLDIPKYVIPASGVVDYQYPVVDNPLTQGRWLKASTTIVDQRRAVHHVLSGFVPEGQDASGEEHEGVYSASVGGYTVGMESVVNPKGIGTWVPPGGKFGFQMHYTPFGKEVTTQERVGLYFYKDGEKPDLMMREMPLVNSFIKLPPNDGNHKEVAYFNFPHDAILHTAVIHAHYRGTYSKLEIRYPSGEQKVILNVPFYDFNWQRMYEFDTPIPIPAGSKVIATYIYDNSKRNPANPDPSKEVVWGAQSFEEMFYTSLRYRWADETAAKQTDYDAGIQKTRLLGMLDTNIDDKVEKNELRGPLAALSAAGRFEAADTNKDGALDANELDAVMQAMAKARKSADASVKSSAGR